MGDHTISPNRRKLLKVTGSVLAASAVTGIASADPDEEITVNVGFENRMGKTAASDVSASVMREFSFDVMTARMTREAAERLQEDPNVRYVEENGRMEALGQTTPYGIETVEADTAIEDGHTGEGVSVSIIDTGIDPEHETLEENLGEGWAASGAECDPDGGGWPFGSDDDAEAAISECLEDWDDDNDHGTHVAGTAAAADNGVGVLGVAPDATLHAVKALDAAGGGNFSDIAAGIEWSADQGHDVINMSLGGPESGAVTDAVEYAASQGVVIVAAAGNSGPCDDCVSHPAAHPEVIAVSATDENDTLAGFSSTGPEVDVAAPGVNTLSTVPRDDYAQFSGTSMASPHVAGAAASLISSGVTDREEVRQRLAAGADDIGLGDDEQGAGRINVPGAIDGEPDDPEPELSVSTDAATGVGEDAATLNATLDDLGEAESAEVHFEWGETGSDLPNETPAQTLSSAGSVDETIDGLQDGQSYEFQAVVIGSDGETDTGSVQSFTTDSGFCYITTATASNNDTLHSLRRFRDESMGATPVGRGLVGLYYRISPPIAQTLERHPESRTAGAVRRLVEHCADLSNAQERTDSRVASALIGVALTQLYVVGILVGAGGHAGIRTRELIERS